MVRFTDPETGCTMIRDESKDLLEQTEPTMDLLKKLGIPPGFKRILWSDVAKDQKVYLWGSMDSGTKWISWAYGPHWVYNKERKQLHNSANVVFMHYPEDLLVRL